MDINLVTAIQTVASSGFKPTDIYKAPTKRDIKPISHKAQAVAREWALKTEAEATILCPITGLQVVSDLPATDNNFLVCTHPIVFNALAICTKQEYINKLSDTQMAGLILALLNTVNKLSIDVASNAFAINIRLRTVFTRAELQEFAEWIYDNLIRTNAYYPAMQLHHAEINKSTIENYTNWIASISNEFYVSNVEERIIKPTTPSTDTQIRRLDTAAYDEWLDMTSKVMLPKSFIEKAKPYIKKLVSTTNADLIAKICSKAEALVKDEAEGFALVGSDEYNTIAAIGELFTLEVMDMRSKAEKLGYYKSQLDEWDTPASVTTQVKVEVAEEAPVEVAPKKIDFLALLKEKQNAK